MVNYTHLICCAAIWFVCEFAHARELPDYVIRRIIVYKTECKLDSLTRQKQDGQLVFNAICSNTTFYPNGLKIICSQVDNENSCQVQTESRSFEYLKLLQKHDVERAN